MARPKEPQQSWRPKDQEMTTQQAQRWFDRTWNKALSFVREHPARPVQLERARKIADIVVAAIEDTKPSGLWKGRAGSNREAVLRCHVSTAQKFGPRYSLAVREIANEINLPRSTVADANGWLCRYGWLKKLQTGRGNAGTRWELKEPRPDILPQVPPAGGRETECPVKDHSDAERDVFGHVGRVAWQTWLALQDGDTAKSLASRLGVKVRQVRKRLLRLEELGFAVRSAEGIWKRRRREQVNSHPAR